MIIFHRIAGRRLKETALGMTCVLFSGDDQVVMQGDPDDPPRLHQLPRDIDVLAARLGVATRVVVNDNDGGGAVINCNFVHFARMDQASVERSDGELDVDLQGVLGVHHEHVKDLGLPVAEEGHHTACDIFGGTEHRSLTTLLGLGTASNFERGHEFHGLCGSDPPLTHQLPRRAPAQAPETPITNEEGTREVQRR